MEISSTSHVSSRPVTASKNSSDRQSYDEGQTVLVESKSRDRVSEQRVAQEKLQQKKDNDQRRLDGRLITFGPESNDAPSQQSKASMNRSRVEEAYSPPPTRESSHKQDEPQRTEKQPDPIDIVV